MYFLFLLYQKISFPESVHILANHYNIKIELNNTFSETEIFTAIYELHNIAMQLFQNNLSNDGKEALQYLYDRGLSEEILKQFK